MRIVSLLACATEMVFALGKGDWLVGRSHECDFPSSVLELPVCSRPAFPDGNSAFIDRQVKERAHLGLSLYEVDFAMLEKLRPDLILTQDQCKVCAVSLEQVQAGLSELCQFQGQIFSLQPHRLGEVWDEFRRLAILLGCQLQAEAQLKAWQRRLKALNSADCSVVALEWLEPLMGCGSWTPEILAAAGARELLGKAGQNAAWLDSQTLSSADPDFLFLIPCGFSLERTLAEVAQSGLLDQLHHLRAVRSGRCIAWDGNAYFNRSGPRLVETAEMVAEALKNPGIDGPSWRYLRAGAP